MSTKSHPAQHDVVLVVDFGAQYAQLIARRVREARVYSEIVPHRITAAEVIAKAPKAIILSGGPKSVHVDGAPMLDPAIYELGIPILGICYGCQLVAQQLGGVVARGGRGEYGRATLTRNSTRSKLLGDSTPQVHDVWMSHFDFVSEAPTGFVGTASTPDAPNAVIAVKTCWSASLSTLRNANKTGPWQASFKIKLKQFVRRSGLNEQSVVCQVELIRRLLQQSCIKQLARNSHVCMWIPGLCVAVKANKLLRHFVRAWVSN
jgi:GMP synthase (glutamine-hydrolysing) A subunit